MLTEEQKIELDRIVQLMEKNKESASDIMFVVNDYKEKYEAPEDDPIARNIEAALQLAMDQGAAPAELTLLQSMHPANKDVREALQEDAQKQAIEALPAGDRYKIIGLEAGEGAAEIFEGLFPYATNAIKKGAADDRIGAGAYADVSSGLGRAIVGVGEKSTWGRLGPHNRWR